MLKKIGLVVLIVFLALLSVFCLPMGIVGIVSAHGDKLSFRLGVGFVVFGAICLAAFLFLLARCIMRWASAKPFTNPYVDMSPFLAHVGMPVVYYPHIQLWPDEMLIYAVPASTYVEKEQVTEYSGSSIGVSVRIAKGLYLRQGANRGQPIRRDIKHFYSGDYVVTNQRLLFLGPQKSFECPVGKVTTVRLIAPNAMVVISGNKNHPIVVNENEIQHVLGFTNTALRQLQPSGFGEPERLSSI